MKGVVTKNGALETSHTFAQEADSKTPYNKTIKKVYSDVRKLNRHITAGHWATS
jgi:hypothetical protein